MYKKKRRERLFFFLNLNKEIQQKTEREYSINSPALNFLLCKIKEHEFKKKIFCRSLPYFHTWLATHYLFFAHNISIYLYISKKASPLFNDFRLNTSSNTRSEENFQDQLLSGDVSVSKSIL